MKKLLFIAMAFCLAFVMTFSAGCSVNVETSTPESQQAQVSNGGNSIEPQVSTGGNSTQPQVSTGGNSTQPQVSTGGNSQKPQASNSAKPNDSKQSVSTSVLNSSAVQSVLQSVPSGGDLPQPKDGDVWVSPTGSDSNSGSQSSPLQTLYAAVSQITPGYTIHMMKGTYPMSSRLELTKSGTESAPITIQAENWDEVVLDYSKQPYGHNSSTYVGIYLKGNWWKIQGLTICHAGDNGIKVEGSHNYIGRCVLHHNGDTGIQLGFGHDFSAQGYGSSNNGEYCAYNLIENCDSYLNYDFDNWGDADGFACKMHNGKGNVFKGCRAWSNCDDAWDLYETDYSVVLIDCWAWRTAVLADFKNDPYFSNAQYIAQKSAVKAIKVPSGVGNGNGIKFGGNGTGGSSKGVHYGINCVAFNCDKSSSTKGFDENNHKDSVVLENCVAWDNGYNYMFEQGGSQTKFTNCISFYSETRGTSYNKNSRLAGELGSGGGQVINCSFTYDGGDLSQTTKFTPADFVSIKEEDAKAARNSDGSLPRNGFAQLKPSSAYYNSGMGNTKY